AAALARRFRGALGRCCRDTALLCGAARSRRAADPPGARAWRLGPLRPLRRLDACLSGLWPRLAIGGAEIAASLRPRQLRTGSYLDPGSAGGGGARPRGEAD